jgi:hypothetical protein
MAYFGCFIVWPSIVCLACLLIAFELRYATAFIVSIVVASVWMNPADSKLARRVLSAQLAAICLTGVWMTASLFASHWPAESHWSQESAASEYLRLHGVRSGDKLAAIQRVDGSMLYLLPLDVQVVSWLRSAAPGDISPDEWNAIMEKWSALHIKAVIGLPRVGGDAADTDEPAWMGFRRVPGTPYFVKMVED